jgi:hypothetical protein
MTENYFRLTLENFAFNSHFSALGLGQKLATPFFFR